jgi:hypothetical protein
MCVLALFDIPSVLHRYQCDKTHEENIKAIDISPVKSWLFHKHSVPFHQVLEKNNRKYFSSFRHELCHDG